MSAAEMSMAQAAVSVAKAGDEAAVWCGGPWLQAASPDEEALVQGAAYAGYRLQARSTDKVEVRYHGQVWVYTVLVVLEFDSDRKRMSIICRCPDGKVRLFCKGADTMIMARVRPGQQVTASVRAHLDGVPEAIEALVASGIKVWVLTGDKVETAISIALSCRLFTEEMALVEGWDIWCCTISVT
ncbi:phospholipid-transporting ATPase [Haematococcus lacustris]|uniref:Phospholipid-transporting ATPase n=1 Tax=Haematococcus lacustris TaxID=44745 RepID=A0A699Z4M8_HAELA|nr:phospholipid-transporting ATPase [Haematococcus lacustris]